MGEPFLIGPDLIYNTLEKIHIIRNRLQKVYSWQKSYADYRSRNMDFEEGDKVYLKISPIKGVVRFGKKGKLSPCYVDPYENLQRVVKVAYELKLPSHLASVHPVFHVSMLKKCIGDLESIVLINGLGVKYTSDRRKFRLKFLIGKSRS